MRAEPEVLCCREPDPAVTPTGRKIGVQERHGASQTALSRLMTRLTQERMVRLGLMFKERCAETHLKGLVVERADDHRRITVAGRQLYNFGSDSFLGLDRDPRVQEALIRAVRPWGTHNGASRIFSAVALCEEAERRLAEWLGVEDTLIFASVTLANAGLIPALAGEGDLLAVDRLAHDSIHQAAKIAASNGAVVRQFYPCRGETLAGVLAKERYRGCVVAVDGVNSMYGTIPPLDELDEVTRGCGGILYVDDAHGTAVIGPRGRGATAKLLGSLDDVLMVGSLSKAFSCMGAFVTCTAPLKQVLKMKSNTFIFGGPVPPPYLAAICAVCEIIGSPGYDELLGRLHALVRRLTEGIAAIGLRVLGGEAPIVSIAVGDIERTFEAGKWLFDRGFFVPSATFPAVPINGGVLRIQVNANHPVEAIDGLLAALGEMKTHFRLPVM